MHVYLREEPVSLHMRVVDADGLVPEGSELVAVAFFVEGNETPSFRSLLPPETLTVLTDAIAEPVRIGLLAEEPEDPDTEIKAMVGVTVPLKGPLAAQEEGEGEERDPWAADPDAWKAGLEESEEDERERTALLAFAPLHRIHRRFPESFGDELADLLETALSGSTRSILEARVDRFLDEL
jgi:hypothetical protein